MKAALLLVLVFISTSANANFFREIEHKEFVRLINTYGEYNTNTRNEKFRITPLEPGYCVFNLERITSKTPFGGGELSFQREEVIIDLGVISHFNKESYNQNHYEFNFSRWHLGFNERRYILPSFDFVAGVLHSELMKENFSIKFSKQIDQEEQADWDFFYNIFQNLRDYCIEERNK